MVRARSRFAHCYAAILAALLSAGAVPSACSDAKRPAYTITTVKDAKDSTTYLRFQTQCPGDDTRSGKSFHVTVVITGPHSTEWIYTSAFSRTVSMSIMTVDGPAWPGDQLDTIATHRSTVSFHGLPGEQQVNTASGAATAHSFDAEVGAAQLQRACGLDSAVWRIGHCEFEITADQLQGVNELLQRLNTEPKDTKN